MLPKCWLVNGIFTHHPSRARRYIYIYIYLGRYILTAANSPASRRLTAPPRASGFGTRDNRGETSARADQLPVHEGRGRPSVRYTGASCDTEASEDSIAGNQDTLLPDKSCHRLSRLDAFRRKNRNQLGARITDNAPRLALKSAHSRAATGLQETVPASSGFCPPNLSPAYVL